MEVTIGVESEMGIARSGVPVNVLEELGGGIQFEDPYHAITGELSRHAAEFVTPVCRSKEEINGSLRTCANALPDGLEMVFKTIPFGWPVPIADVKYKPRYPIVREALMREHPCGYKTLDMVAPYCALQFHIGVDDVNSPGAVLLRNFLDNIAPYARLQVIKRYGITDADQHLMVWRGWSKIERVPHWRWFADADEVNTFVGAIPKLVTQSASGAWIVADSIPSKIGDPVSEGTIWWLARPRGGYQTVEWRPFPTLNIEQTTDLTGDIIMLMQEFWRYFNAHPLAEWRTPEQATRLFKHLSQFDLVPPEPLSKNDWMCLYVQ